MHVVSEESMKAANTNAHFVPQHNKRHAKQVLYEEPQIAQAAQYLQTRLFLSQPPPTQGRSVKWLINPL